MKNSQRLRQEQVRFLEEKLGAITAQYNAKLEGAERWRVKAAAKYGGRTASSSADEVAVTKQMLSNEEELVSKALLKLGDGERMKATVSDYRDKVKAREQNVQKLIAKAENVKSHIAELTETKTAEEKKLFALEQESLKYKDSYSEICVSEKTLEHQREDRRAKLEAGVMRKEEEGYRDFLKKNGENFSMLRQTYGIKMADKIKQDHRKEIGELALVHQLERRNAIRKAHSDLQRLTAVLDSTAMSDSLTAQLGMIIDTCKEKKEKVDVMQAQLEAMDEAEHEVMVQMEDFLKKKKTDLEQSTQLFYRKKNYAPLQQKLNEISIVLDCKHGKLEGFKSHSEQLRGTIEEKRKAFAVHKMEQRMKLEGLQRQLEEVQTVVRAHLRALNKQVEEYNAQIVNDKKRVGVLNEKLNSTISDVNMAKARDTESVPPAPESEPQRQEHEHEDVRKELIKEQLSADVAGLSDKHSILANPSESGSVPKFGCISVNLADLNVTGSEEDKEQFASAQIHSEDQPVQELSHKRGAGGVENIMYSGSVREGSRYMIDVDKCSVKEVQLFEAVRLLLEGVYVDRKYKKQTSLKEKTFDPLQSNKFPPEVCGFGKRFLSYNPAASRFEFRVLKKPFTVDHYVSLFDLKQVVVPGETRQIIRAQRALGSIVGEARSVELSLTRDGERKEGEQRLDRLARSEENELFREQCASIRFYPFSILAKDSRIELVAETYPVFKTVTQMLSSVVENVGLFRSLSRRLIAMPRRKDETMVPNNS